MDPRSLDRFIDAQAPVSATALREIQKGLKRTHWMWFIFPQLRELGRSSTAKLYGIADMDEARAYLDHPILGTRFLECVAALQDLETSDAEKVFGAIDAMKLRSSLTLFEAVGQHPLLEAALDRWFKSERDPATLRIIERSL